MYDVSTKSLFFKVLKSYFSKRIKAIKLTFKKHTLIFKQASGTSRGILKTKDSWFIQLTNELGQTGIGECSLIQNLSPDNPNEIADILLAYCTSNINNDNIDNIREDLPALRFGLETALMDLNLTPQGLLYQTDFSAGKSGIIINGLIWMGEKQFMFDQIKSKIESGFRCIKMKIGAIDFQEELSLLKYIRSQFSKDDIELRVDANGAFAPDSALDKLKYLAEYDLHSIEQPIKQGQLHDMAKLCEMTPLAIALDEELIGLTNYAEKEKLLAQINPQYIILKPSLIGGLQAADEWIEIAETLNIGWWATSALESNIGLNAIAQWVSQKEIMMPQGLGTGLLFTNNVSSPLFLKGEMLHYNSEKNWEPIFDS